MKKPFILFFTILIILISTQLTKGQGIASLSYDVRFTNINYLDTVSGNSPYISGHWNVLEFDIYIQQTNIPSNSSEIMRFALGQYYINLNFGGLNAADTVGGYSTLKYISGSTDFLDLNALPTGPKCVAIAPSSDIGATWNGVLGGYLNLYSNNPLGGLSNVQISNTFPGTKVGRYRLKKNITASSPSPFFPNDFLHLRWRIAPAITGTNPNPVTKIFAYNGLGGASTDVTNKGRFIMDTNAIILNLKVLAEGLYYPLFNQLSRKDSVTVILRNASFPYAIAGSSKNIIDSINHSGQFFFNSIPVDTFYIVVKHFSCIETWSRQGGELINNNLAYNYDFTTSKTKAFGDNLVRKGTKYCIYSGDVNQDNTIDAADISAIENDASVGLEGYSITDLNGDVIVDAADLSIVENNVGVAVVQP